MMQQIAEDIIQHDENSVDNIMIVSLDNTDMLIPQSDIQTFEDIHQLDTQDLCINSIGWINCSGNKLPVYCFSNEFDLQQALPENRSICVILKKVNVAIMCSDIKVLNYYDLTLVPLPDCMSGSRTPVDSFCFYRHVDVKQLGMLFSANSLKDYIECSTKCVVD